MYSMFRYAVAARQAYGIWYVSRTSIGTLFVFLALAAVDCLAEQIGVMQQYIQSNATACSIYALRSVRGVALTNIAIRHLH